MSLQQKILQKVTIAQRYNVNDATTLLQRGTKAVRKLLEFTKKKTFHTINFFVLYKTDISQQIMESIQSEHAKLSFFKNNSISLTYLVIQRMNENIEIERSNNPMTKKKVLKPGSGGSNKL